MRLSNQRFWHIVFAALASLSFLNLSTRSQAFGAQKSFLWSFGNGNDGAQPLAGLIMDKSGNLFGTTESGGANQISGVFGPVGLGTVFELKRPTTAVGKWKESVLWNFGSGSDGNFPYAGLIMDKSGNLYGTTNGGGVYGASEGGDGTVFELKRPSKRSGKWIESILWNFGNGSDGNGPFAGLIMDATGNLYGTTGNGGTENGGTVFELTPPATAGGNWTESVLWNFGSIDHDGAGPGAGLIMDSSGDLYGTTELGGTSNGGTAFELMPPATNGGEWTESILWSFGSGSDGNQPFAGLTMDSSSNLYGTTQFGGVSNLGTAFELTPPSTIGANWTESVLWSFGNPMITADGTQPEAGLTMDMSGNLFGTTAGNFGSSNGPFGTAFELIPPVTTGENWTESILWNFDSNGNDGFNPQAGVITDGHGNFFGTTAQGGASAGVGIYTGAGTVFEISTQTVLTASAAKLSFGNVDVAKTSKPKKVTLTNKGTIAAQISSVTATAPFSITSGTNTCSGKSIEPKKTCSFEVEFAPTIVAEATGAIDVAYDGTSPALALKGNGIKPR